MKRRAPAKERGTNKRILRSSDKKRTNPQTDETTNDYVDAWEQVSRILTARECVKYLRPTCRSLRDVCDSLVDVLEIRDAILVWRPDNSCTHGGGVIDEFAFYKPTAGGDGRKFNAGDYVWNFDYEPFPLTRADLWEMKFSIHLRCDAESDQHVAVPMSIFCLKPVHAVIAEENCGKGYFLSMEWPYFRSFEVEWKACEISGGKIESVRLEILRENNSE